ncbi:hypothetical protein ACS0TY_016870 [Phlomoides rotata]
MYPEVLSCVNVLRRHAYAHHGQMQIRVEGSTVVDIGRYVDGGGCDFFKWSDPEMSERARTLILNLLQEKNRYKALKHEKLQYDRNIWKYALVGSWLFFFAFWLLKF